MKMWSFICEQTKCEKKFNKRLHDYCMEDKITHSYEWIEIMRKYSDRSFIIYEYDSGINREN